VIEKAAQEPSLLAAAYSASAMWTANAATVSPSADSADHRLHLTPANLVAKFHRTIEAEGTYRALSRIFQDEDRFAVHRPLFASDTFGDEGAANHTRFAPGHGAPGLELFVHGRSALDSTRAAPRRFPARQTLEASEALARIHQLDPARVVHAQQNPAVIDLGVFHNDVISVGNQQLFFFHALAFADREATMKELRTKWSALSEKPLVEFEVSANELPVEDAVASYLFNSQIVTRPDGKMSLIAPAEAHENERARRVIERLLAAGTPIDRVEHFDLRESMRNGGGPACLRLRVVMSEAEIVASNPAVHFDDLLHGKLIAWVERWYRDRLEPADLADPKLLDESRSALDALSAILGLGGAVFDFQR
jgi:succinylarginine dihydrolase